MDFSSTVEVTPKFWRDFFRLKSSTCTQKFLSTNFEYIFYFVFCFVLKRMNLLILQLWVRLHHYGSSIKLALALNKPGKLMWHYTKKPETFLVLKESRITLLRHYPITEVNLIGIHDAYRKEERIYIYRYIYIYIYIYMCRERER